METIQRRGDLSWFKALEKQWENRPQPPPSSPRTNPNRQRLIEFYQKHNPTKLDEVDKVLAKYEGKEEELFEKLERRYLNEYPNPPLQLDSKHAPICFLQFSEYSDPVKIRLFSDITPMAAENFRQLCRSKYRDSKIHRIVPGMCIQGGDYNGTGGRSIYPATQDGIDLWGNFPDETFLSHNAAGLLSMANNGRNRNGSQFFITLAPAQHLDGKHVVFGRVIENLNVVLELGTKPTNDKEEPLQDISIVDCGEIPQASEQQHTAPETNQIVEQHSSRKGTDADNKKLLSDSAATESRHKPNLDAVPIGSSSLFGAQHDKPTLQYGSAAVKDTTLSGASTFGLGKPKDPMLPQLVGDNHATGKAGFMFGGSQQSSLNAPSSQFGGLSFGSIADKQDPAVAFGKMEDGSKGTFGGMVDGLSFGSLALSDNTKGVFGTLDKDTPSPFQTTSSTAFTAPSTMTKSAASGWFSQAAADISKEPSIFSSRPSSSLFGTVMNETKGGNYRQNNDDSESTGSEYSEGSEYVDNSVQDDARDKDVFDEYHYTPGDEQIASLQPHVAKIEVAVNQTPGEEIHTEPPLFSVGFSKSTKSWDSPTSKTLPNELPVSGAFDRSSLGFGPKSAKPNATNTDTGKLPPRHEHQTKDRKEINLPPEFTLHDTDNERQANFEQAPLKVPSEVVCEHNVSVEATAKRPCQVPITEKFSSKIPDEVVCQNHELPNQTPAADHDDNAKSPDLVHTDTLPIDNTTTDLKVPTPPVHTRTTIENNRPPERIEFEEKSSNMSFESQDLYTPNGSRIDEYDRFARQSVGGETMESDVLNSIATVDSSVSGQAELLRRDIEVCSLDIKEALRRVELQKERVRSRQASSLTNTPTRYSRSLLPPQPHDRPQSLGKEITRSNDNDPASRFVYLTRIANKFSNGAMSRRSLPDDLSLRREASSYTSPVLVQDDELETMQRESRSVQPLVETFERWTKDHVEKQKKDHYSEGEDHKK